MFGTRLLQIFVGCVEKKLHVTIMLFLSSNHSALPFAALFWHTFLGNANKVCMYVSAVKIHRRAFVSCSRVKACNFSGFVNISSETFLERLSPLNELRNYGDR